MSLFRPQLCHSRRAVPCLAAAIGKKSGDGTQKLTRGEEAASENGNGGGLLGTIFKTAGTQRSGTQGKRGGRGGPDAGTGGSSCKAVRLLIIWLGCSYCAQCAPLFCMQQAVASVASGHAHNRLPTCRPPATVFVAGATGRLGARCVRELLAAGFRVRAGVRSAEKAEEYLAIATSYGLLSREEIGRLQVCVLVCERHGWWGWGVGCEVLLLAEQSRERCSMRIMDWQPVGGGAQSCTLPSCTQLCCSQRCCLGAQLRCARNARAASVQPAPP